MNVLLFSRFLWYPGIQDAGADAGEERKEEEKEEEGDAKEGNDAWDLRRILSRQRKGRLRTRKEMMGMRGMRTGVTTFSRRATASARGWTPERFDTRALWTQYNFTFALCLHQTVVCATCTVF